MRWIKLEILLFFKTTAIVMMNYTLSLFILMDPMTKSYFNDLLENYNEKKK